MVKNIVYLTQAQWDTLISTGSITVGSVTHVYDEDNDYRVATDIVSLDNTVTENSANGVKSSGIYSFVMGTVNPASQSSMPTGGFKSGAEYDLGVISNMTFLLADGIAGKKYMWTFETGSTAPSITWPTGIQWPKDFEPAINASTHYEVNIRNGYAYLGEFEIL